MDPAVLLPVPDPIPIASAWFHLLLILTLFIHLLLMNVMLGSAFIALVHHLSGPHSPHTHTQVIAAKLPFTVALAVNFGVAPLLFVQVLYGHLMYVSSILMAVFWLSIIALLILAYTLCYVYKYRYEYMRESRLLITALLVLCLFLIAFFFTSQSTLMQNPGSWSRYFAHPKGLLLNLSDPTLIPRYLHITLSAIAIGGLALALWHQHAWQRGETESLQKMQSGCQWFGYATLLNFSIGFWFLGALPQQILTLKTTEGILLLLCLLAGIILAIPAIIFALRHQVIPATVSTLAALLLMICARHLVRVAMLAPWFSTQQLTIQPCRSPFLLFLAILLLGGAVIIWMLKTTTQAIENKELQP